MKLSTAIWINYFIYSQSFSRMPTAPFRLSNDIDVTYRSLPLTSPVLPYIRPQTSSGTVGDHRTDFASLFALSFSFHAEVME